MNYHTTTLPKMKIAVASKENANYVAGRRAFFKYRDLGVTDGTNGFMRAQVTSADSTLPRPCQNVQVPLICHPGQQWQHCAGPHTMPDAACLTTSKGNAERESACERSTCPVPVLEHDKACSFVR